MLHARVAQSEDPNSLAAAGELLRELAPALEMYGEPRLLLVWAAIDTNHQLLLQALREVGAGALVVGCTTDGETSSGRVGFADNSIVVMALWSPSLDVGVGSAGT